VLTINRAVLTVTPDAKSKTYDNAVFTNALYTSTITGYQGSDTGAVITGVPTYSGTAMAAKAAGSYTIGRGYDPGVLSGDSGVGFSTELRYDRLGVLARYDIGIQPYGFVDTEWVWNRNTPAGTDPQQVTSLGAGARIGVADKLRLDLAVAVPLRDAGPTRAGDVRVLMSLTARLIPWSAR
jgi:hypothetical protein